MTPATDCICGADRIRASEMLGMKTKHRLTTLLSVVALIVCAVCTVGAQAQKSGTAYKLSDLQDGRMPPPFPLGAITDLRSPRIRVIPDQNIWLIDDTALVSMTNKANLRVSADVACKALASLIVEQQQAHAASMLTNPVVPAKVAEPPREPFKTMYSTNSDLGMLIMLEEKYNPGARTNYSSNQLGMPSVLAGRETNSAMGAFNNMYQLPAYINKRSPTFKRDLEEYKKKMEMENRRNRGLNEEGEIEPKGSGGGDYYFPNNLWYQIEVTPLPAPTYSWPTLGSNGIDFRKVWPGLVATLTFDHSAVPVYNEYWNDHQTFQQRIYLAPVFILYINYPALVCREPVAFVCLEVNFYGECTFGRGFDITNRLQMPAGGNKTSWQVTVSAGCDAQNPLMSFIMGNVYGEPPPAMPGGSFDPHTLTPPAPTFMSITSLQSYQSVEVVEVPTIGISPDSTNATVVGSTTTDINGRGSVYIPETSTNSAFYYLRWTE